MNTTEIDYNADELVGSVESLAGHLSGTKKVTLRSKTLPMPSAIRGIRPREIKSIRTRLNVSQPVFAAMLNIPAVTAVSWETGRRKPTGAALRLLDIARRRPDVLMAS